MNKLYGIFAAFSRNWNISMPLTYLPCCGRGRSDIIYCSLLWWHILRTVNMTMGNVCANGLSTLSNLVKRRKNRDHLYTDTPKRPMKLQENTLPHSLLQNLDLQVKNLLWNQPRNPKLISSQILPRTGGSITWMIWIHETQLGATNGAWHHRFFTLEGHNKESVRWDSWKIIILGQ